MPALMATLAELIRQQREAAGLTQPELAARSGVNLSTLRNYEQGRTTPTWPAMVAIGRALGCSLDTSAGAEDGPAPPAGPQGPASGRAGRPGRPRKRPDGPAAPE